jgi:mRNA interferase RelE/StbE
MEFYRVEFAKSALKDFKRIPQLDACRILNAIIELAKDPRSHSSKKLKGEKLYRIRIGNYRVIYEIQDERLLVSVIKLGHRKDVYKN